MGRHRISCHWPEQCSAPVHSLCKRVGISSDFSTPEQRNLWPGKRKGKSCRAARHSLPCHPGPEHRAAALGEGDAMAAITTPYAIRAKGSLLIASPDEAFRRRLLKNAAYADCASEEATGGAHALAKLGQIEGNLGCGAGLAQPVSVLLDRHLPDLDAIELAEMIRERYPRVAVKLVDSRAAEAQDVEVRSSESQLLRFHVAAPRTVTAQ